jgi:hypothetical protein
MEKDSNNNIYGSPEYLCRLKIEDYELPKELAKEVLEGKFDYKKEEEML